MLTATLLLALSYYFTNTFFNRMLQGFIAAIVEPAYLALLLATFGTFGHER